MSLEEITLTGDSESLHAAFTKVNLAIAALNAAGTGIRQKLYNTTTAAVATELFTDGSSTQITMTAEKTTVFYILLGARQTAGSGGTVGDSALWRIEGAIKRDDSDTTAILGTVVTTPLAADTGAADWSVAVTADDTNEALCIKCTGETNKTINWVASVSLTEAG